MSLLRIAFIEMIPTGNTTYSDYRRWLSLDSAVAVTQFRHGGRACRREVSASHPAQMIVARLTGQFGSVNVYTLLPD